MQGTEHIPIPEKYVTAVLESIRLSRLIYPVYKLKNRTRIARRRTEEKQDEELYIKAPYRRASFL
jgi:hypothetical protein